MLDLIQEIYATVRRNKLRTTLTGFSVAWGIFMLIFLLGAGNGLIRGLTHNTDSFLANSMMIFGGSTSKAWKGMEQDRGITLNGRDISTTAHAWPGIVKTTGAELRQSSVTIATDDGHSVVCTVRGVYPNEAEINKITMLRGRFINNIDINDKRKVIVITDNQARQLQPESDISTLLGKSVKVGNISFEIAGISKADESGLGEDVYAPFTTIRSVYARGDEADDIVFSFRGLKTEKDNDDFEKQYKGVLNTNHDAAPDDGEAIWIWNRLTQNMQMAEVMSTISTALWVVGLLTLISGIVGVGNIMLISVRERTREFGIRKAIGAKPWSILRLIITESVIITTFFGYIGMVLGIAANQYLDATIGQQVMDLGGMKITTFLNPTVGLDVCVEATIVMIVAGTLAGIIPARKAASVRPIEALNAE